ncbi:hypothetical protein H7X46_12520 [Pseudonocardia sp. C8]|nr:hypothetical protein [Pseudonocardia sp. C8]MBC3191887.1 hypothetical protein [Pseudonocardia sp. C8]
MSRRARTRIRRAARSSKRAIATTILMVTVVALVAGTVMASVPAPP